MQGWKMRSCILQPCTLVHHFPLLHFLVLHFQRPRYYMYSIIITFIIITISDAKIPAGSP